MSMDTIGDFLTIIRNGISVSRRFVIAPHSVIKQEIAQLLRNEGFIKDFEIVDEDDSKKLIKVYLKYVNGESAIHELKRVSTPGKRTYLGAKELGHIRGKLGISVVTTNKGILTDKQARDLSVGGEIIMTVW